MIVGYGLPAAAGPLLPIAGKGPDADYTFKVATGFSSVEAYGKYLDVQAGGFAEAMSFSGGCWTAIARASIRRIGLTV